MLCWCRCLQRQVPHSLYCSKGQLPSSVVSWEENYCTEIMLAEHNWSPTMPTTVGRMVLPLGWNKKHMVRRTGPKRTVLLGGAFVTDEEQHDLSSVYRKAQSWRSDPEKLLLRVWNVTIKLHKQCKMINFSMTNENFPKMYVDLFSRWMLL